jgi:hypothetical protein
MLFLNDVTIDPSQANCTTCGVVGNELALGAVPEPSALALMSTGLMFCIVLARRRALRSSARR